MAKDPTNIIPERGKKLHEIYIEKFGNADLRIKRGMELQSQKYQLKLASLVLDHIKELINCCEKRKVSVYVNGCFITHYGLLTKEEIIEKYRKAKESKRLKL